MAQLNLHPDAQGKVKVPLSAFPTRTLKVYVINEDQSTSKALHLEEQKEPELADLRLQTASDPSKVFAYEREVYKVQDGQKLHLPGFVSSEYELINNLSKLLSLKTSLSGSSLGTQWDFLKNWNTLKIGQKVATIDQMFSYELAVFLFKRDREFFDVSLKDFIKCKISKGIVDYYLLEDTAALTKYLNASELSTLNTFERICLIDALSASHPKECQAILQIIQGQDAFNVYDDNMAFSSLFDRIVSTADQKGGSAVLQSRANLRAKNTQLFDDDESEEIDDESDDDDSNPGPRLIQRNRMMDRRDQKPQRKEMEQKYTEAPCEEECQQMYDMFGDDADECEMATEEIRRPSRRRAPQRRNRNVEEEDVSDDDDEEDNGDNGKFDLFEIKKRRQPPTVSRLQNTSLKTTMEYREMGYYFQAGEAKTYTVNSNLFWIDLARHLLTSRDTPFLSENIVYVENNHLPFALAFISLSESAAAPTFSTSGNETYLTLAGGHGMLFLKHLKERAPESDTSNTVLVAQKWFDKEERFVFNTETETNEEKTIDWFVKGRIYGSQVVATNVSSVEQKVQIITEIPRGAIPVSLNDFHQSLDWKLDQFSTRKFEFFFYFPKAGQFSYCPACVTRDGKKVPVQASSTELKVLDEPPKKDQLKSINDILTQGSKEDVLAFMRRENIGNPKLFAFEDIYWLLRDEQFYTACLQILRDRLFYDETVWSYSVYHGDTPTLFELLSQYTPNKVAEMQITYFHCDSAPRPLTLRGFEFLEYHPIVNARFHQLSKENSSILNREFFATYLKFLMYWFEKGSRTGTKELLDFTYYLLLQDRIDEAFSIYNSIAPDSPELVASFQLQYDYMGAYFDLYKGMPAFSKAKEICERYFDYPIVSWRNLFIEIANQLAEFGGEATEMKAQKGVEKAQGDQEVLRASTVGTVVEVDYANLTGLKIELFEIDLEVLFSLYPFQTNEYEKLVFSQPHHVLTHALTKTPNMQHQSVEIPEPFAKRNLIVKVFCV